MPIDLQKCHDVRQAINWSVKVLKDDKKRFAPRKSWMPLEITSPGVYW
jgi:hypothetical protein